MLWWHWEWNNINEVFIRSSAEISRRVESARGVLKGQRGTWSLQHNQHVHICSSSRPNSRLRQYSRRYSVGVAPLSYSQGSLNDYVYRKGLPKKFQSFYFFDITNPTEFRKRLQNIIPLITTTTQALADTAAIQNHKSQGNTSLLKIVGTNVAFSQAGLTTVRYFWFPTFKCRTLIVTSIAWDHRRFARFIFLCWTTCGRFKKFCWWWYLRPWRCDRRENWPCMGSGLQAKYHSWLLPHYRRMQGYNSRAFFANRTHLSWHG